MRYNKQHRESLIVPRKMSNNFYGRLSEKESIKRFCTMMAHIKKKRRVNEEEEKRGNIYYEWKWTWQDSSAQRWQLKKGEARKEREKCLNAVIEQEAKKRKSEGEFVVCWYNHNFTVSVVARAVSSYSRKHEIHFAYNTICSEWGKEERARS